MITYKILCLSIDQATSEEISLIQPQIKTNKPQKEAVTNTKHIPYTVQVQ